MTTISDITGISSELLRTRAEIAALKETLDFFREKRDSLEAELLTSMKANSLKQWKTLEATISRSEKTDIRITNEEEVLLELTSRKLLDDYFIPKLDALRFKNFALQVLKQTGEVLPGTTPAITEFISIRNAKEQVEQETPTFALAV